MQNGVDRGERLTNRCLPGGTPGGGDPDKEGDRSTTPGASYATPVCRVGLTTSLTPRTHIFASSSKQRYDAILDGVARGTIFRICNR